MTTADKIILLKELQQRQLQVDGDDVYSMLLFITANFFEGHVHCLTEEEITIVFDMNVNQVEYFGQGVSVKRIA
jgi:hypothetical protein